MPLAGSAIVKVVASDGVMTTPSMVAYHATQRGRVVVGEGCKALDAAEWDVLSLVKRLLGRNGTETGEEKASVARAMLALGAHAASVTMDAKQGTVLIKCRNGEELTPLDVMVRSIAAKREEVLRMLGHRRDDAYGYVATVPAYWKATQRELIRCAYRAAGVDDTKLLRIVQEPTAAVFGLLLKDAPELEALRKKADKTDVFAVFDLGGGTFDVSVVEGKLETVAGVEKLTSQVLHLGGDLWLGGSDMEAAIVADLVRKYPAPGAPAATSGPTSGATSSGPTSGEEASRPPESGGWTQAAKEATAVRLMHAMSTAEEPAGGGEREVKLDAVPGVGSVRMTETELGTVLKPLLDRMGAVVRDVASRATAAKTKITRALAVGGPTSLSLVVSCFGEALRSSSGFTGRVESFHGTAASTMVVEGAARLARAILDGAEIVLKDMTAFGIGVTVRNHDGKLAVYHLLPPSSPVNELRPSDDAMVTLSLSSPELSAATLSNAQEMDVGWNDKIRFTISEGLSTEPGENAEIGTFEVKIDAAAIEALRPAKGVRVPERGTFPVPADGRSSVVGGR